MRPIVYSIKKLLLSMYNCEKLLINKKLQQVVDFKQNDIIFYCRWRTNVAQKMVREQFIDLIYPF